MTNSIFIDILKHIKSINMTNIDLIIMEINEYLTWLNWSQIIYGKDYNNYVLALENLRSLFYDKTKSYEDICDYISDLITYSYLSADENEV